MHNADHERGGPSRRAFVSLGAGAFVMALMPRFIRSGPELFRRTVPVMGTIADIGVVHRDAGAAEAAIDAAITALRHTESTMTWFRADSDVGRANDGAARDAVAVSPAVAGVVAQSLRWADATGGSFDPAIGRLVRAWGVDHRTSPPARDFIQRFVGRRLYREIEVGRSSGNDVLRFHDPDVALDLGGIAKGQGVDRAVSALRDRGIRNAIINVGGDLFAMGSSADGDAWRIGIRSPSDPAKITSSFEVRDRAVATSGDYEQGFVYMGRRYHHIIDPRTAEPRIVEAHSITVAADLCITADAAATALFGSTDVNVRAAMNRIAPDAVIVDAG